MATMGEWPVVYVVKIQFKLSRVAEPGGVSSRCLSPPPDEFMGGIDCAALPWFRWPGGFHQRRLPNCRLLKIGRQS